MIGLLEFLSNFQSERFLSANQSVLTNYFKIIPLFVSDRGRAAPFHDLRFW